MSERLSKITDGQGFIIERHRGNVLHISRTDHRTPTAAEIKDRAAWYWRSVGVKGNDPQPLDPAPRFAPGELSDR